MTAIEVYDTTLRDGCQAEDVAFTNEDKLRIVERLDDFGVRYVEGGWPGSNPRDSRFFQDVRALRLTQARVAAFGSTRRPHKRAAEDENLEAILRAGVGVATIVGKTWDLHVESDLRIPLDANLDVIHDSVAYLVRQLDEVIFDAEHFFDGWIANPDYALACIGAAREAGARLVCLCDTRGGALPVQITAGVEAAQATDGPLGIHCHNDMELAVANSVAAVRAGAVQVQGTINGVGERCGNANLCSVVPALQLKMGYACVEPAQLARLQSLSRFVYELANLEPVKRQPFVGASAFAHKGGLHVAAVQKQPETYEHMDPGLVGNVQRVLVSDLAGRSNIVYKAAQFGLEVDPGSEEVRTLLSELKDLEHRGFQFEGAEASFELLMQKTLNGKVRHFRLIGFRVIDEKRTEDEPPISEATIMLEGPDGQIEHTAAQGNGPVNALDRALRKALIKFYPEIDQVSLLDYKVRVLETGAGTEATVRVLIEAGDEHERWGTVGVSRNVIEASWQALVDSLDYQLYRNRKVQPGAVKGARKLAPAGSRRERH